MKQTTNGPVNAHLIWTAVPVFVSTVLFSFACKGANDPCPVGNPGVQVAGFIKRITKHCYTQTIKVTGLNSVLQISSVSAYLPN